jgi:tetratricopeptide (TPR) repeat protein
MVVLFFILGLMSKPILVTLPIVLLLLDAWPLGRLSDRGGLWLRFREKVPLFVLSMVSCLMTILTQQQALSPVGQAPLFFKACHVIVSTCTGFTMTFWPVDLAAYYPMTPSGWPATRVVLSLLLMGGITSLALLLRKSRPYVAVGWFWYLVMLAPVSGIVQAGDQAYADRFTLLPQIGILIALVWIVDEWAGRVPWRRLFLGLLAILVIATLALAAFLQASYWRDSISLMQRALAVTERNALAHENLGDAYRAAGRLDEALREFQASLDLKPSSATNEYNMGTILAQQGLIPEAMEHFQKALELNPRMAEAHNNLGGLLKDQGRLSEASSRIQTALERNPDLPEALSNLAGVMALQGKVDESLSYFRKAEGRNPSIAEIHNILGTILLQKGIPVEALAEFEQALALQPWNATYANNLAAMLATIGDPRLGDAPRAIRLSERALDRDRDNPAMLRTLAVAYARSGERGRAISVAERALDLAESHGQKALAGALKNDLKGYREEGNSDPKSEKAGKEEKN